jgi:hypothetical protein
MDAAAKDFAKIYNKISIKKNREYGTYIYKKTKKFYKSIFKPGRWFVTQIVLDKRVTYYAYVKPKKGTKDSTGYPKNWFGLKNKVATAHTHAAYDEKFGNGNDIFSDADKTNANKRKMPSYVATPIGRLLKYNPSSKKVSIISEKMPFDKNHPSKKGK